MRHLIVIVHGVGKHDEPKRARRLGELTKNKNLLLPRIGSDVDFEFQFVEWHNEVQSRRMNINEVSMPKGAKLMKDALRDVVSDVLFYAESTHRDKILNSVALQINAFHLAFATKFPESAENLHILAHSLGGVVAFDLLCAHNSDSCQIPNLACNPKNLFICGSPLGLFLSIRGGEEASESTDTTSPIIADKVRIKAISRSGYLGTTRCRNILHPMDVLAYRLEPLLFECPSSPSESPSGQESSEWMQQPRDIPYHKGRLHTHKRFKNIGKMLSKSLSFRSGEGEADCKEGVKQQGSGFRQGLRGIFRRGLRRGTDTADTSLQGEEALLKAAESGDWCKSELESAVEQIEDACEEPHQNGPETSPQGEAEWQMQQATTEEASGRPRIDFKLQRSAAESMSDFITTIRSHRAYWHSKDFLLFVLYCTVHGRENTEEDIASTHSLTPASTCTESGPADAGKVDDDDNGDDGEISSQDDLFDVEM